MINEEYRIAVALCDYMRNAYPALIRDKHFFAFPAGEHRNKITAGKIKRAGGIAGVPDYILTKPCGPYAVLFIELKTKTGRLSPDQKTFLRTHKGSGCASVVAYGYDEAVDIIESYLKGDVLRIKWYETSDAKSERNEAYRALADDAANAQK